MTTGTGGKAPEAAAATDATVASVARAFRGSDGDRPGFTLDLARCVGCGACALACRMENGLPSTVSWRRVLQVNRPRVDGGPTYHLSVACHHCERPPCVGACPSGALGRGSDGVVLLVSDRCIGCRYCEMACPFGALSFDPAVGVMTKCHLCHHRLAEGLMPACVDACPTGALGLRWDGAQEPPPAHDGSGATEYVPASTIPGFGDPGGARPGFWVAPPGGAIRDRWFQELKGLFGHSTEESSDGP